MNKGKEHALEIDLGHDQRGNRIIWDTKDSPTLTVTGHEGCGKTTFADRIMLEAQRDGASVTRLGRKGVPLPSPTIMNLDYGDDARIIELLERAQAEQRRRMSGHPTETDAPARRPLLLVFDDFDAMTQGEVSDERPCGAYKTISVLLNGIIGQARQTGMAVILTGRGLNRRTMGRYLAARLREEATHVHLGAAPVTPLIRKSNHSHATTMIVNTEADMRTPFGWGAYEDNTGAVRQLRTDIDGKEPGR